jgi:hypothetical protein
LSLQDIHDEIQKSAIKVWREQKDDHPYGYVETKIAVVTALGVRDTAGIVGMFDIKNQRKLYNLVSEASQAFIDKCVGGLGKNEYRAQSMGLL